MEAYVGRRITEGFLDYTQIITLYPSHKEKIDANIIERGFAHLIVDIK